ncbi:UNVERIFIED_CONTAM: hypothetical protein Sradi_0871600 [Sesamum radiatum]|uniref:Uncharacterized protein n=1 Tax=Sesamum radiatum TaxID=300843 RepID=A0AAW2V2F7_SESRA
MSVDGATWDVELIRVLFPQTEADNILAVPIHSPDNEDQLVWHCDARGQFTVRSACRLAMEIDSESAEASGDPPNWAFIWKKNSLKSAVVRWAIMPQCFTDYKRPFEKSNVGYHLAPVGGGVTLSRRDGGLVEVTACETGKGRL